MFVPPLTEPRPCLEDWRAWTAREWNERLFNHLFGSDETAKAVTFIPATCLDLRHVTGDGSANPGEVEEAFVRSIQASPNQFRRHLSKRSPHFMASELADVLELDSIPGYFVYLYFTCLVASGADDPTLTTGRFRDRLRAMLGHEEASYGLRGLGALWESLRDWLRRRDHWRPLVLPDPGHMTLIGYSVRLAFPTFRDRRRLAEIYGDLQTDDIPVRLVVERFRRRVDDFDAGSRVRYEFRDFERRFTRGDLDLGDHPFWTAVSDAATLDYNPDQRTRARGALVISEPSAIDLPLDLVTTPPPPGVTPPAGVSFERLRAPLGEYAFAANLEGGDPCAALLESGGSRRWKPSVGQALCTSVREGVLLFARGEDNWPVTRFSLPEPGRDVWLLARQARLDGLIFWAFDDDAPAPVASVYPGWSWAGPFDSEHLQGLDKRFASVPCLQPTVTGPTVRLVGGARSGSAYLGVPGALPHVAAPRASRVERVGPDGNGGQRLARGDDGTFWERSPQALTGSHTYFARDGGGRVVGNVRARFVPGHVGIDYKGPTTPSEWRAEGASADTVAWDECLASELELGVPYGPHPRRPARRTSPLAPLLAPRPIAAPPRTEPDGRCGPFVEVAAARAAATSGLAESEFIGLLSDIAGVPEGPLLWMTARAWVEAGCLDALSPVSWTNKKYFARPPRLIAFEGPEGPAATLAGLVPAEVRARVASGAGALGLTEEARPPSHRGSPRWTRTGPTTHGRSTNWPSSPSSPLRPVSGLSQTSWGLPPPETTLNPRCPRATFGGTVGTGRGPTSLRRTGAGRTTWTCPGSPTRGRQPGSSSRATGSPVPFEAARGPSCGPTLSAATRHSPSESRATSSGLGGPRFTSPFPSPGRSPTRPARPDRTPRALGHGDTRTRPPRRPQ